MRWTAWAVMILASCWAGGALAAETPTAGDAVAITPAKQKPPIDARFHAGYHTNGTGGVEDSWVPVHLDLTNNTETTLRGTLECHLTDTRQGLNEEYACTWRRDVTIAGMGTRKHLRLHIAVPPGSAGMLDEIAIVLKTTTHGWIAPRNGTVPLPVLSRAAHVVRGEAGMTVGREIVLLLDEGGGDYLAVPQQEGTAAVRTTLRGDIASFPTRWSALSGMSAVVWNGAQPGALEPIQRQALLDYVAMGGHLVVAGGAHQGLVRGTFLEELLPITAGATGPRELARFLTGLDGPADMVTATVPTADARVLHAWDGLPLAVRAAYGAGTITYCAFSLSSPALRVRPGDGKEPLARRAAFLDTVLSASTPAMALMTSPDVRERAERYLRAAAKRRIPPRGFVLAFAAVYILTAVPLLYVLFRGLGRVEHAWVAVPFVALLFFSFIWQTSFLQAESGLSINEMSFAVTRNGNSRGAAVTLSNYLSPTGGFYSLGWREPSTESVPLRGRERLEGLRRVAAAKQELNWLETDERTELVRFAIGFNDTRLQEHTGLFALPGALLLKPDFDRLARAVRGGGGRKVLPAAGECINLTGLSFERALLVMPGKLADRAEGEYDTGDRAEPTAWTLAPIGHGNAPLSLLHAAPTGLAEQIHELCAPFGAERVSLARAATAAVGAALADGKEGAFVAPVRGIAGDTTVDGRLTPSHAVTFLIVPFSLP